MFLWEKRFMETSIDSLFSMLQAEQKTGEILPLPKTFYKSIQKQLDSFPESSDKEGQHNKNFRKLLTNIKEKRLQKLLIYLAYNKQLPSQIPDEEEEIYLKIKKTLEKGIEHTQRLKKIKIATEMPELVMPNGNKIGPYKHNQVVELEDANEADFLLNNKLGEPI